MASKLSKWFKKNKWAVPLGVGALALAAPWAAGAMMGGGGAAAGAAGAGAGAAGAAGAGAGAGAAGAAGVGSALGTGAAGIGIGSGLGSLGTAGAGTFGATEAAGGGLSGLLAAHPGWTGALKGAGAYGLEQGRAFLNQPPPQPMQMPPGWDELNGYDSQIDDATKKQLARLQAYFSGRYGGGGYNA